MPWKVRSRAPKMLREKSEMGHNEKNSQRAYVFRIASDSCRRRAVPAVTFSARSGHSPTSPE